MLNGHQHLCENSILLFYNYKQNQAPCIIKKEYLMIIIINIKKLVCTLFHLKMFKEKVLFKYKKIIKLI